MLVEELTDKRAWIPSRRRDVTDHGWTLEELFATECK